MAELNWNDVEDAAKQDVIILLPVGVIEEHGPHLSLGVDILCSYQLCRNIKGELAELNVPSLIAPPFYWGINNATSGFPGSFTVRKETFRNMIIDILVSLNNWGFERLYIINWHGDKEHLLTLAEATKEAREEFDINAKIVLTEFEIERLKLLKSDKSIINTKEKASEASFIDIHAGSDEVSVIYEYFPKHLNKDLAQTLLPTKLNKKDIQTWNKGGNETREMIPQGYFGNPSDFSKNKGKTIINKRSKIIANKIANL